MITFVTSLIALSILSDFDLITAIGFDCYEEVVRHTQRCDNHNIVFVYVDHVKGAGFGHLFNTRFMHSILRGAYYGQRTVYVLKDDHIIWDHECISRNMTYRLGLTCYFEPPCEDSFRQFSTLNDTEKEGVLLAAKARGTARYGHKITR